MMHSLARAHSNGSSLASSPSPSPSLLDTVNHARCLSQLGNMDKHHPSQGTCQLIPRTPYVIHPNILRLCTLTIARQAHQHTRMLEITQLALDTSNPAAAHLPRHSRILSLPSTNMPCPIHILVTSHSQARMNKAGSQLQHIRMPVTTMTRNQSTRRDNTQTPFLTIRLILLMQIVFRSQLAKS